MRARLEALGVTGVRASTFHSAALGQLRFFSPEPIGKILASKALPLRYIGNSLPRPYRFRPAADLATEVEWAKNRRIAPADYVRSLGDHEPPIPADLMVKVYRDYERRKADQGYVDFEDLLEMTIRLFDADAGALEQVRDRYRAFTVDEYQDVNMLQQTLLDRWLGDRDELCAVGDDYQSIYAFTGASPEHLLSMPERFPEATVVRLEENYRSTPRGARVRESPGASARRRGEGAAGDPSRRRCRRRSFLRRGRGRGGVHRRAHARPVRGRHAVRGHGAALPNERALRRLRGGSDRGKDSVSGRCPALP